MPYKMPDPMICPRCTKEVIVLGRQIVCWPCRKLWNHEEFKEEWKIEEVILPDRER